MGIEITLSKLRENLGYLIGRHNAAKEARTVYTEAVDAIAAASGIEPAVIKAFVSAKAADKYEDKKRNASQLQLCFDEIGE